MKKVFISVIFLGIVLAIIGVGYLSGNTASQPIQSYLCCARGCTDVCNGSTRCILEYWDGKKEYYCCPHCAFPERMWKLVHGEHIRKTMVVDFETGKPLMRLAHIIWLIAICMSVVLQVLSLSKPNLKQNGLNNNMVVRFLTCHNNVKCQSSNVK